MLLLGNLSRKGLWLSPGILVSMRLAPRALAARGSRLAACEASTSRGNSRCRSCAASGRPTAAPSETTWRPKRAVRYPGVSPIGIRALAGSRQKTPAIWGSKSPIFVAASNVTDGSGAGQEALDGSLQQTLPEAALHGRRDSHDAAAAPQPWRLDARSAHWGGCGLARLLDPTSAIQVRQKWRGGGGGGACTGRTCVQTVLAGAVFPGNQTRLESA